MHLGLVNRDAMPAWQYLPGTFSADVQLPFVDGASLGPEYLLDFDLNPLI
ncbi:MAG: hypothetical protein P4M11_13815 [Candidatus Pacebacteria bacterium]|nr:hypothetical protein [Candidatus Paceibacterota bacterium]